MRIDSHMHVWSFPGVEYYDNRPLFEYMEGLKLNKTSLIAVNDRENEQVKELVSKYPDQFFGIAHVNRERLEESLAALREGVNRGWYSGVKVLSYAGGFHVDDEIQMKIYGECLSLGIPVLFHVGWHNAGSVKPADAAGGANTCKYACVGLPVELGNVLEAYPDLKAVFAHMGAEHYFQCLGMAQRFPNVYLDTAWLDHYGSERLPQITVQEWVAHACRYLGADRVLYGGEYTTPEDIEQAPVTAAEKRQILGYNAARLYGLSG